MNQQLTIANYDVRRTKDGLYHLNDLHQAAGGEKRHQPSNWLRSEQTQELISLLTNEVSSASEETPTEFEPLRTIQDGPNEFRGTYVCKELVCDYAMWIDRAFHLKVIRAFFETRPLGTPEELEALRIFNGHVLGGDLTFHGVLLYAQRTLDQTGIDVLKLTGKSEAYAQGSDPHGVREFLDSWAAEELGLLWTHCRVKDLYAVYKAWRAPAECLTDEAFSSFIERNMAPALTIHWFDTLERGPVLFPPIPRASGKRARIEQITTDCERFAASARLWIKRATV